MSIYISSALVLAPSLEFPLTHARIGWQSIATTTNISGTAGLANYPLTNIVNPATFERYKPSLVTATIDIDAGVGKVCDYVALQQKNVTTVEIYSSTDDITYTLLQEFNNGGQDGAIMALFTLDTARYWRVVLNGSNVEVIAFKIGESLALQRGIYGGHSPITLSPVTAERPNLSETGQWLGVTQERKGLQGSFAWTNLTSSWYRAYFDPFVQDNPRANPFFIAWRPSEFPQDVAYCWAKGSITPSNTGTLDFMSVSMNVEGYVSGV